LQPELGSYLIWNLGLAYQWQPNITVRAKVDNLFDKAYQTNLGYRTAGVEFGLSVQVLAF
jgi:vitamin B12 transporter